MIRLATTTAQFDGLHTVAAAKARKGNTKVAVDRAALAALLRDHSTMIEALRGRIEGDVT